MKPPPISENEGEQSGVSSEKEPDTKLARVKDITINTENAEHLLENNIVINNLKIPEKLSKQTKINNSLQRDEETYELEKFKKNAMQIFNHENFLVGDRRLGTALDVAALEDTFKQFRFEVTTRNDLTKQNLLDELERFSTMDFKDYGCICVAILTHGQDGGFLRAFDTRYRERDAFSCFDALANPTLVGKPIIFLIQACRGSTAAARVPYGRAQHIEFDADTSENDSRPTESDMIIFHSSFFGRASVRVVEEGSWFIQTLCEQMELHGSTDHLEELFLRVRQNVAALEYNGVKQMPVVTCTLLRKLYLKKIEETKITVDCDCRYVCADCKEHAHIAYNGGSAPDDTYNGGSAPDDTYNGGSAPDDTYNGGSALDLTYNGGSSPDLTYNGGNAPDLTLKGGSAPDLTYNGGSAPDLTFNGGFAPDLTLKGGSAPDFTYNGGSAPDDTYNAGFAPYKTFNGGSAPDLTYNGGSTPDDTYNGGSAPDLTYNGCSTPDDTYNGGSAPDDTYNGGSAPDLTYNGGSAPDGSNSENGSNRENGSNSENGSDPDTYEETDGSNSENVTSIARTYRRRTKIEKFFKAWAFIGRLMMTPEYRIRMSTFGLGHSSIRSI